MQICLVHADTLIPRLFAGIAYLSAFLRQNGFRVNVIDFPAKYENICSDLELLIILQKLKLNKKVETKNVNAHERYKLLDLINSWCEDIIKTRSEIVGFTVNMCNYKLSTLLAKDLKKERRDILTVFGGPQCGIEVGGKVIPGLGVVDVVVHGEGEEVMLDIAKNYQNSSTIDSVKGATILKDGKPVYCGERPPIKDLDSLPFPDFTDFELQKYPKILPIVGSRGCIYRCSFCYHPVFWKTYRERSPPNIVAEMHHDVEKYEIRKFEFGDSLIDANLSRLEKMCDLIIESDLSIEWKAFARMDRLSPSLLSKMHQAGCKELEYGLESFSAKVLRDMRKRITPEKIFNTLVWTTNSGIAMGLHFLTGFPTESKSDFVETLLNFYDIFRKGYLNNVDSYVWLHTLIVDPGTHLFLNPHDYGLKIKRRNPDDVFNLFDYRWTSKKVGGFDRIFRIQMLECLNYELKEYEHCKETLFSGVLPIMDSIKKLSKSTYGKNRIKLFENLYDRLLLIYASSIVSGKNLSEMLSKESIRNEVLQSLTPNN